MPPPPPKIVKIKEVKIVEDHSFEGLLMKISSLTENILDSTLSTQTKEALLLKALNE